MMKKVSGESVVLLDVEPCILELEKVVDYDNDQSKNIEPPATDAEEVEQVVDASALYWMCYNARYEMTWVEMGKEKSSSPRNFSAPSTLSEDHAKVLRLRLKASKKGSHTIQDPTDQVTTTTTTASSECFTPMTGSQKYDTPIGTRLLHEDDRVKIWEFRLMPGERCQFHYHQLPYCFTNLTGSTTRALDRMGQPTLGESDVNQTVGQTVYVSASELGSHAVLNVGTTTFLQFIVEFKVL